MAGFIELTAVILCLQELFCLYPYDIGFVW